MCFPKLANFLSSWPYYTIFNTQHSRQSVVVTSIYEPTRIMSIMHSARNGLGEQRIALNLLDSLVVEAMTSVRAEVDDRRPRNERPHHWIWPATNDDISEWPRATIQRPRIERVSDSLPSERASERTIFQHWINRFWVTFGLYNSRRSAPLRFARLATPCQSFDLDTKFRHDARSRASDSRGGRRQESDGRQRLNNWTVHQSVSDDIARWTCVRGARHSGGVGRKRLAGMRCRATYAAVPNVHWRCRSRTRARWTVIGGGAGAGECLVKDDDADDDARLVNDDVEK